jgi:hypothetical protein
LSFGLLKEIFMTDPNLLLNGLALDALQALALVFVLLATTLFALLLLALGLAAQARPLQPSAKVPRQRFARTQSASYITRPSQPLALVKR